MLDELENLKFRIKMVKNLISREREIATSNAYNMNRAINMSYMLRHRIKNSKAFKHFKALTTMIDYK